MDRYTLKNLIKIDANYKIEDARRIVDLKNWIIHGYDQVDDIIILGIISKDIPKILKTGNIYVKNRQL